jgi:hypothetical protein
MNDYALILFRLAWFSVTVPATLPASKVFGDSGYWVGRGSPAQRAGLMLRARW